ncbi:MAG: hypothetical protein U0794_04360 [Isosphaeraceae bacterium]
MININCPLCGGHLFEGEACGSCYAPAPVIESIIYRERAPKFVGVLGPSGVGKTVFLGMLLDLLSRGAGGLHGIAKGPFSLALHRNLILALERQRFPEKTPTEADRWAWVHCEVTTGRRGQVVDIVTPDVAGEAVMAELETPKSNPTIRSLIDRCSGLVVLVDIVEVVGDGQGQELFAMQLISYLDTLRPSRRRGKVDVPVALVFTKTDLCEGTIRDPESFARSNAPALYRLCDSRLKRFRFDCSGVAGSTGRLIDRDGRETLVPLRVEPRGVVEPFSWLINQI